MTDLAAYAHRTALVTGASGIVGSWLVKRLLGAGVVVVALVRDNDPRSEFIRGGDHRRVVQVRGSVEDLPVLQRVLTRHEVDVVFHLAAQTQVRHAQRQPWVTLESNVRGTYSLLEAVRGAGAGVQAVVVASSDKAYGESTQLPYTEDHPLAGRNVYDASKSAADLIASSYATSFGLPIGIARCGNIYGPGDLNWDRIVPGTMRSLLQGERPIIRSDGTLLRDYMHVDDAVAAYLAIGAALIDGREKGEAFNFGTGEPISVLDLVVAVTLAVGRPELRPLIQSAAPNEIPAQWLDATKARIRLGWTPGSSLADGLSRSVDWYRRAIG